MRGDHMKVFISWSGDTSLKVAQIFREWIPSVIQSIEPYVSSEDIDKGARWSTDIAKELEDSSFGILCVTKDNLTAPWLCFEAGALSKTMEKSFVTPFLFDIKRSEVNGPILQFQSTIFDKEDIKRMVKTLNKASGEGSISETRLEKAFEVWYPNLESSLNELKNEVHDTREDNPATDVSATSEILEEILELSRDNQKLLRNPDTKLDDEISKLQDMVENLVARNGIYNRRRSSRRLEPALFDEIIHITDGRNEYSLLMILSFFREDLPWLYDLGKELLDSLRRNTSLSENRIAIRNYRELVDFSFGHPLMRDIFCRSKDTMMMTKEAVYALMHLLDRLENQYC